jgi:hypothetical protein
LAGDLAGFQDQLAAAPVEFLTKIIEHSVILQMRGIGGQPEGFFRQSLALGGWRRLG